MSTDMAGRSIMISLPRDIVEDSPALSKRLKNFQEAEERAKVATALLGTAEEIAHIRASLDVTREETDRILVEARADVAEMMETAQANASTIVAQAQAEAEKCEAAAKELTTKSEEVNQAAVKVSQRALEDIKKVEQREANLDNIREQLQGKEAILNDLKDELLQEKSKLATVRETIDQVLR